MRTTFLTKLMLLFWLIGITNTKLFSTTITTSTTYSSPTTIGDDLFITNNSIVTINNTIFNVNGKIEVEPGSRLIINKSTLRIKTDIFLKDGRMTPTFAQGAELELINNSLITSYNNPTWGRIEAWGSASGDYFLSAKVISNGSKIEKANIAIANYKYNGTF